jgi:transcription antitermination factor NusG
VPVFCHALYGSGGRVARLTAVTPGAEWHAVHTRSRAEFRVRDHLQALGVPQILPTWTALSQWHDRRRLIERPLFSGYLFARGERRELAAVSGVARVFGPVSDDQVAALALAAGDPARVAPFDTAPIPAGAAVTVTRGPFATLTGRVARVKAGYRLIVTIDILGRACAVEIDACDLIRAA